MQIFNTESLFDYLFRFWFIEEDLFHFSKGKGKNAEKNVLFENLKIGVIFGFYASIGQDNP